MENKDMSRISRIIMSAESFFGLALTTPVLPIYYIAYGYLIGRLYSDRVYDGIFVKTFIIVSSIWFLFYVYTIFLERRLLGNKVWIKLLWAAYIGLFLYINIIFAFTTDFSKCVFC
jgi:hypothetical protein